ncbi:calcium-binding protein [uncultured Tateyamaria sp.]|uniref:calcium-binding protein n=1 Tax=uncultured Tateyamaria sp. TaxID=455651 RepID=UPI0026363DE0|nr:calcium-binding protein [uncultured Tateyamaria sp.]
MELLLLLAGMMTIGAVSSTSSGTVETETDSDDDPVDVTDTSEDGPIDVPEPSEDELIEGTDDNDSLNGLDGDDTIFGMSGHDALAGGAGSDFIDAGAGDDKVLESGYLLADYPDGFVDGDDTIFGGEGNDYLDGYDGNDSVDGGSGNDTVLGRDGDDTLTGGTGKDDIYGLADDDSIDGGAGDDTLSGGAGSDTIIGGNGNDAINAKSRDDRDDEMFSESLDGGAGDDTIRFGDGSAVTGGSGADSFIALESLSNTLVSEITDFDPSQDTLFVDLGVPNGTTGGEFTLQERDDGQGRDLFLGDELVLRLSGDTPFTLDDISLTVRFEYSDGTPVEYTIGDSENGFGTSVIGSAGDDIITGSSAGDAIATEGGSDIVNGGAGDDIIFAQGGNVVTYRDESDAVTIVDLERDTIDGGAGDDIIVSFNSNDLTGGEGDDVFVLQNDPGAFSENDDVVSGDPDKLDPTIITDFTAGEDTILVRDVPGTALDESDISITALEDGTGAELTVEGQVVAIIIGGQDLTIDDIAIQELPNGEYVPYDAYNVIEGYLS